MLPLVVSIAMVPACRRVLYLHAAPGFKKARDKYSNAAAFPIRYSLVGQDTALSPRRPGFDSRYRKSSVYGMPCHGHFHRCSIVVSISACHAGDPGSIPGVGELPFADMASRVPLDGAGCQSDVLYMRVDHRPDQTRAFARSN